MARLDQLGPNDNELEEHKFLQQKHGDDSMKCVY